MSSPDAIFGVLGLGYVGLPLAARAAAKGIRVIGFDVDEAVTEAVNAGRSHVSDLSGAAVAEARAAGLLEATADMSRLSACDAVAICVPTPLSRTREPDIRHILAASTAVAASLRAGQARRAGVHHLSGHDAGGRAADPARRGP